MDRLGWIVALLALWFGFANAQDLAERVHEFELDNGLDVIMVVQDAAPVIAFNLMFDVGGIDEPNGLGGIAHMVEHMAFKGTSTIGSLDYGAERAALAEVELAFTAIEDAEDAGLPAEEIAELVEAFVEARARAQVLATPNALDLLFDANGAVGLNAGTGFDRTSYVVSLPSNRLELYARVYADILLNPVFRSFYEERDVVREERRQRSEDDPQGVLFEAFLDAAYEEHPYGRPLIGAPEAIQGYSASEAKAFFDAFYYPDRAVLVMVGDLEPERDIETIERYFGVLPSAPDLRPAIPEEPDQTEERRVGVEFDAEPQVAIGYHKPTYPERDAYVLDVISGLLSDGRTSRLFERLVIDEGLALSISSSSSYPGIREPNLFILYGLPRAPNTTEDIEAAVYEELERLKTEPVGERELEKVKNGVRAGFIRSLRSGSGLASQLAFYELFLGGWEEALEYADIIESVTPEEIMEVAERYFTPDNRTVATLVPLSGTEDAGTEETDAEDGSNAADEAETGETDANDSENIESDDTEEDDE